MLYFLCRNESLASLYDFNGEFSSTAPYKLNIKILQLPPVKLSSGSATVANSLQPWTTYIWISHPQHSTGFN